MRTSQTTEINRISLIRFSNITVELTRRRESRHPPPHHASCERRSRRSRPTNCCAAHRYNKYSTAELKKYFWRRLYSALGSCPSMSATLRSFETSASLVFG